MEPDALAAVPEGCTPSPYELPPPPPRGAKRPAEDQVPYIIYYILFHLYVMYIMYGKPLMYPMTVCSCCVLLFGWMDGWMDGWVDGWVDGWMGVARCCVSCKR
jgi:hypothetical protein